MGFLILVHNKKCIVLSMIAELERKLKPKYNPTLETILISAGCVLGWLMGKWGVLSFRTCYVICPCKPLHLSQKSTLGSEHANLTDYALTVLTDVCRQHGMLHIQCPSLIPFTSVPPSPSYILFRLLSSPTLAGGVHVRLNL